MQALLFGYIGESMYYFELLNTFKCKHMLFNFTITRTVSKIRFMHEHEEHFHSPYILYIAGDLLPLSSVESPQLRNFVEKIYSEFQMPSRKQLSSKLIHEKAKVVRENVQQKLKRVDNVRLIVDLWSNRMMKSFFGITVHFILNWVTHSVMIFCKRFKGKHTAENILHEYEETIKSYYINEKMFCVVSDNVTNMV